MSVALPSIAWRKITKTIFDAEIESAIDRNFSELGPVELSILQLGVYELMHRIDVPFRVVINEGVELAKIFGAADSHKYVNSILDVLSRRHRSLEHGKHGKS